MTTLPSAVPRVPCRAGCWAPDCCGRSNPRRDAVLRFQAENGLNEDGIVGEDTFRTLMSAEAKRSPTAAP